MIKYKQNNINHSIILNSFQNNILPDNELKKKKISLKKKINKSIVYIFSELSLILF